jgi:fumarate reductase flavoprotein subunit
VTGLKRRSFIGACVLNAAFPWTGAASAEEPEFDLVVVGAGAAGFTAACTAQEAGVKRVLLLEKEPFIGGSSILARGSWSVTGTPLQKERGVEDSDEAFIQDILEEGRNFNNLALVRAVVRASREEYLRLEHFGLGAENLTAEKVVLRVHRVNMPKILFFLRERFLKQGGELWTGARAFELLRETDRVSGIRILRAGKEIRIRSRLGVVLATGGFARNKELLAVFAKEMESVSTISPVGCDGDGLLMASKLGAGLADTEFLKASYACTPDAATIDDKTSIQYLGAVIVNQQAERFVSESSQYHVIAEEVLKQPQAKSFIVFDEPILQEAAAQEPDKWFWRDLTRGIVPAHFYKGFTIGEIAAKAYLDPAALAKTIADYNENARRLRADPVFHRVSFKGTLPEIAEPPFYLMEAEACLIGTYCGIRISPEARVLTEKGEVIPGLWTAGEAAGGIHGASSVMGMPLAVAFALGRIAGLDAAGSLK